MPNPQYSQARTNVFVVDDVAVYGKRSYIVGHIISCNTHFRLAGDQLAQIAYLFYVSIRRVDATIISDLEPGAD
jgi:hypothetical protein